LSHQLLLIPYQILELPNVLFRNETPLQKTCKKKFADPFAILLVRFMPSDIFNVTGIYKNNLKVFLQNVEYRLSVHARRLHGYMSNAFLLKPPA